MLTLEDVPTMYTSTCKKEFCKDFFSTIPPPVKYTTQLYKIFVEVATIMKVATAKCDLPYYLCEKFHEVQNSHHPKPELLNN